VAGNCPPFHWLSWSNNIFNGGTGDRRLIGDVSQREGLVVGSRLAEREVRDINPRTFRPLKKWPRLVSGLHDKTFLVINEG